MNIKNIAIVLTVLLVAIAAMLLMQKGNYVDQATEHYNKTTQNTFKATSKIVEYVSNSIDVSALLGLVTPAATAPSEEEEEYEE